MSVQENIPMTSGETGGFKNSDFRDDIKATAEKPIFFDLKVQMLKQGRTNTPVCKTDNMWGVVKVYASGGENGLHAHTKEDHLFLIMQGSACFFGPNGEERNAGTHEGILLAKGCYYNFQCTSKEPLVLFRIGCHTAHEEGIAGRLNLDGGAMAGDHKDNKQVEVIYDEGVYFE
jgi:hypothetical protein